MWDYEGKRIRKENKGLFIFIGLVLNSFEYLAILVAHPLLRGVMVACICTARYIRLYLLCFRLSLYIIFTTCPMVYTRTNDENYTTMYFSRVWVSINKGIL